MFRILVVSDIHAHQLAPSHADAPSYQSTSPAYRKVNDPIGDLYLVVENLVKEKARPDVLLCPGDIADRADPTAQGVIWTLLEGLREQFKIKHLIGTAGNHDLDSRRSDPSLDPKSHLQCLTPPFPLKLEDKNDRYWSRNYVILHEDELNVRIVILNSSAFHGYASEEANPVLEYRHGKISPLTLANLSRDITTQYKINILVLHHHPIKNANVDDNNSAMENGQELVDALEDSGQQWLIVHGHLHYPKLSYAPGNSLAPIVFSAGSLSAKIYPGSGLTPRNQAYLIEIDPNLAAPTRMRGEIRSWDWTAATKWQASHRESIIPHRCGFGYKLHDIPAIISAVADHLKSFGRTSWDDICSQIAHLRHLTPSDLQTIVRELRKNEIVVLEDCHGLPNQLEWSGHA